VGVLMEWFVVCGILLGCYFIGGLIWAVRHAWRQGD
jgi:hypothetical protein